MTTTYLSATRRGLLLVAIGTGLFFFAVFSVGVYVADAQDGSCARIHSGDAAPEGFGVPWSVVSSAQELLIDVACGDATAHVSLGTGEARQYIYHEGYRWSGSEWQKITFSGDRPRGNTWLQGSASGVLPVPTNMRERTNYFVAYLCEWDGDAWQCGCRDQACSEPYWQVQAFNPSETSGSAAGGDTQGFRQAASASELREYVESYDEKGQADFAVRSLSRGVVDSDGAAPPVAATAESADDSSGGATGAAQASPERFSETNVQVAGLDEPDIVKTNGENIFLMPEQRYRIMPLSGGGGVAVGSTEPAVAERALIADDGTVASDRRERTIVIDSFPLAELGVINDEDIDTQGEMLLVRDENMLVVFGAREIAAYDISDPAQPDERWTYDLEDRSHVAAARLVDGEIYLVTTTWLDRRSPCPIVPLARGTQRLSIPCTDVWVPSDISPVNVSYTIVALDPADGDVSRTLTFAGDSAGAVVSVFPENLYLAYRQPSAMSEVMIDFYAEELEGVLSRSARDRIATIRSYDITEQSKLREVQLIVERETTGMGKDDRLAFDTELSNRLQAYLEERLRETDRTTVARIPLASLTIAAEGDVPGHLLNQFSMDEYDGHLRLATTIGDRWRSAGQQRNDVYVLNRNLDVVGSVEDLGLDERIYAARFIGERGYLVTFREIDPFYVLDLSDPSNPSVEGELKIPGFSSYLEPLGDDLVLGVGREGSGVKLSLFDVSDPTDPVETDKYEIDNSWSEVGNNHRAFLRDDRHGIFFIPTGQGGFVFSYAEDTLTLEKAVAGRGVRRALFIDDYLYVIDNEEIRVFDEETWEEAAQLSL